MTSELFNGYRPLPGTFDEFFTPAGQARPGLAPVMRLLDGIGCLEYRNRQRLATAAFLRAGVTFSVYSDRRGVEKIFPFDLIPRVIPVSDWRRIERGLHQRLRALNAFLGDVYHDQRILREGRVPRELVAGSTGFIESLRGLTPRGGVYIHVAGIDIVRAPDGRFLVLEDNVRTPSGVSYVMENRAVMKRVLPNVFTHSHVLPIDEYPTRLRGTLAALSPVDPQESHIVVLTPGPHNSAYFEHSFLARRMGCELVHGSDLFVQNAHVYLKTTQGPRPVHVIYRRIDDTFLDPAFFRPDSMLGVRDLVKAYAAGNVTLANALGNGVADDKAIYPYVPEMIRFYLSEEPLLDQVETLICSRPEDCQRVLAELSRYVVKAVDASGGYGMLMGPQASQAQLAEFQQRVQQNPRGYIAQPLVEFSTCPTWTGDSVEPRRVDLRPYVLTGKDTWVVPGGLTRVALVEGSYVVNSSQGGGSKDTWVLEEARA